jgi:hypothetical protein
MPHCVTLDRVTLYRVTLHRPSTRQYQSAVLSMSSVATRKCSMCESGIEACSGMRVGEILAVAYVVDSVRPGFDDLVHPVTGRFTAPGAANRAFQAGVPAI